MANVITGNLSAMRRRVRLFVWLHGMGWVLGVALLGTGLACLLDYWLRLEVDVRVLLLAMCAIATGWTLYKQLLRPLTTPLGDVELALRLERLHPEVEERFSSAVEFLRQGMDTGWSGSPAMVRATVEEAFEQAGQVRFTDAVQAGPLRWVVPVALTLLVGLGTVGLVFQQQAGTALARLLNPFGDAAWPKRTQLRLDGVPPHIAKGDDFRFNVQIDGVLPRRVIIHYTYDDGEERRVKLNEPGRKFEAALSQVTRSFRFTVTGGDDTTESQRVDVVERPALMDLLVECVYPEYSGEPPATQPAGVGNVTALAGTQVVFSARVNHALAPEPKGNNVPLAAKFMNDKRVPLEKWNLSYDRDNNKINGRFEVTRDDGYRLDLWDGRYKSLGQGHHRVTVKKDAVPDVFLNKDTQEPPREVLAGATLDLTFEAHDDYGIQRLGLAYVVRGGSDEDLDKTVEIVRFTDSADKPKRPRKQPESLTWKLADLKLPEGAIVTYWAWANDYDTQAGRKPDGKRGTTQKYVFQVIGQERFRQNIEAELAKLRQDMEATLHRQEGVHKDTARTSDKLKAAERLDAKDADRLSQQRAGQQAVQQQVSDPKYGLHERTKELLEQVKANEMDDKALQDQLERTEQTLGKMADKPLPSAVQQLSKAQQSASKPQNPSGQTPQQQQAANQQAKQEQGQALDQAKKDQKEVIKDLKELLNELGKFETVGELLQEAKEIQQEQKDITEATSQAGQNTVGKPSDQLTPEEQSKLDQAAGEQERLAQKLEELQQKIEKTAQEMSQSDPMTSQNMQQAAQQSQQSGTSQKMQQASQSTSQNQTGQAGQQQEQAEQELQELVENLEKAREQELDKVLEELKKVLEELEKLLAREKTHLAVNKDLQDKKAAMDPFKKLSTAQGETRERTTAAAGKLEGVQADAVADCCHEAAGWMTQAVEVLLDKRDRPDSLEQMEQAVANLEKAIELLKQKIEEVEEELQQQKEAEAKQMIEKMIAEQKLVLAKTIGLDDLKQKEGGKLKRRQLLELQKTSDRQNALLTESKNVTKILEGSPVFHLVMRRVTDNMDQAHKRLKGGPKGDPGPITQALQQRAIDKLQQILDAMEEPEPEEGEEQESQSGEPGEPGEQPEGIDVAQLKMLRTLQAELNEVTIDTDTKARADGTITEPEQTRIRELGDEQATLVRLVNELIEAAQQGGEEPGVEGEPGE